jgi:hypothetical protein
MPDDDKVWDKGTPFQSTPAQPERKPQDDDIIWDKGTPFESREPKSTPWH